MNWLVKPVFIGRLRFKEIAEAWEVLGNDQLKSQYELARIQQQKAKPEPKEPEQRHTHQTNQDFIRDLDSYLKTKAERKRDEKEKLRAAEEKLRAKQVEHQVQAFNLLALLGMTYFVWYLLILFSKGTPDHYSPMPVAPRRKEKNIGEHYNAFMRKN